MFLKKLLSKPSDLYCEERIIKLCVVDDDYIWRKSVELEDMLDKLIPGMEGVGITAVLHHFLVGLLENCGVFIQRTEG
jgi:hypothetical protein